MSRFIKLPIKIPEQVKVQINQNNIKIEGPKGKLEYKISPDVEVVMEDKNLRVNPVRYKVKSNGVKAKQGLKMYDAICGTMIAIIRNMVIGVTQGYEKTLVIVGQGYKVLLENNKLSLQLGFANPVKFEATEGIKFEVPAPQRIIIRGIDKELVGRTAAVIRAAKPPEPYKGKGIAYMGENIRRKAGKKAIGYGTGAAA